MSIKYSVIIPHFNSEEGLRVLLDSIPNKENIEVVVVDDRSSTDNYRDVIQSSNLANISCYVNDGVKGAGAARNIGVKKSKGEFLVFADSDDFFTPGAFEIIDEAVLLIDDNTDVIFFNVTSENSLGQVGFRHIKISNLINKYTNSLGEHYEANIRLTHNGPIGKVFKSKFVTKYNILFDEVVVANDVMFSTKTGKLANKIFCMDKVIYCITQGDDTLTSKKSLTNFWGRLEVYVRYYSYLSIQERQKTDASPLPLLLTGLKYGPYQTFKAILYLKRNNIFLFKYMKLDKTRLKRFMQTRISKFRQ